MAHTKRNQFRILSPAKQCKRSRIGRKPIKLNISLPNDPPSRCCYLPRKLYLQRSPIISKNSSLLSHTLRHSFQHFIRFFRLDRRPSSIAVCLIQKFCVSERALVRIDIVRAHFCSTFFAAQLEHWTLSIPILVRFALEFIYEQLVAHETVHI